MKFYFNKNRNKWACSYEKDPSYLMIFLDNGNPATGLINRVGVENSDLWEEYGVTCTMKPTVAKKENKEFTVLEYTRGDGAIYTYYDNSFGAYKGRWKHVNPDAWWIDHPISETPLADFKNRKITKVRRESDGVVFSLGDVVVTFKGQSKPYEITSFSIYGHPKEVCCTYKNKEYVGGFALNNNVEKVFKTEESSTTPRTFPDTETAEAMAEMENKLDAIKDWVEKNATVMKIVKVKALMKADNEDYLEELGIKTSEGRTWDDMYINLDTITTITKCNLEGLEDKTSVNFGYDGCVVDMTVEDFINTYLK